jgi:NAD(P)-dependent dehydrogenase (short-subunit alcohol dehydrogenase family)
MAPGPRIALVTGANRGIGLEVVRQLAARGDTVVLGARDLDAGRRAAGGLGDLPGEVRPRRLDVTDAGTLDAVAAELSDAEGHLDVLVNNAAIHYDTWQQAANADLAVVAEALDTNLLGAWRCVEAFLPLLRASGHGRIVDVSSEGGSLASMGGGIPAYRASKAALNALTRMLAAELRADGVLVTACAPAGWRPTWAVRAVGRWGRARRACSGPRTCPTAAPPAASSATAGPSRSEAPQRTGNGTVSPRPT